MALAFAKLTQAIKSIGTGAFFGLIYQAVLLLTKEDFYIPALESLSKVKENSKLSKAAKDSISKSMLLLDCHIYQKLNDYNTLTTSMLSFIRASFESMPTSILNELVLQVFY